MRAIVLAAGMGRGLAPLTDRTHTCLLRIGEQPLLSRMLRALDACSVSEAVLVVGHCADQVRQTAGRRVGRMSIRYIENPAYGKGSVLSLYAAREHLVEPALVMDSHVLFPREFVRRLLVVPAPSVLLLDRAMSDIGDEVKCYARGDRVIAVGKKFVPESWELVGEGVGVFKCGAEAGPEMVRLLERVINEGDGLNDYQDALNLLVASHHVGWADVTGLPWTAIDFAEDLRRAQDDVLPHLVRLDGA